VKKRVDDEKFMHRSNAQRALALIDAGKMAAPGLEAFEAREGERTGIYTYEQGRPGLSAIDKKRFMKNAKAWRFFASQPPG
jgi:hypothetical protein